MIRTLPSTPQNSVVVASEIWPSLSFHSRALQLENSRTRVDTLCASGCSGASVRGMRRLNKAAITYRNTITEMAASGAVLTPVSSSGKSNASKCAEITLPTN